MLGRGRRSSFAARLAGIGAVLAALAGCAGDGRGYVSEQLAETYLPALADDPAVAAVADWRALKHPDRGVREDFVTRGSTYRVASATRDSADLVVWMTAPTGAEPFNANRVATGVGCVHLQRDGAAIRAQVKDCPSGLPDTANADDLSWGRDSNAVQAAHGVADTAVSELTWVMNHMPDGTARTTAPEPSFVIASVRKAISSPHVKASLSESALSGRTLSANLDVVATAPDSLDASVARRARACFVMTLNLDQANANEFFSPVPCR